MEINNLKNKLISSGKFPKTFTPVHLAAVIYYVCNDGQRLEIVLPETCKKTKITHKLLSSKCGSFAPATLTKQVDIIKSTVN